LRGRAVLANAMQGKLAFIPMAMALVDLGWTTMKAGT